MTLSARREVSAPPAGAMLVVGYGTMAAAMVEGWLAAGMPPAALTIYNPRPKPVPDGTRLTPTMPQQPFDRVLLAVKPHLLPEVAPVLQAVLGDGTAVLSVLAGVTLEQLRRHLPTAGAHVRFMPNLAAAIGQSPNALIGSGLTEPQRAEVTRLAEMLGTAEWLEREEQFDLVTALAGSGPAFMYRFTGALAAGAAELGLPRDQAERLAVQMVRGAAELLARSELSPAELAGKVASKGGMTQAGLDVLDTNFALERLLCETLRATRDKGTQLSRSSD